MPASAIDNDLKIEAIELKKAAIVLRAVNHKLRQQLLHLLHKNKRMMVTSVFVKLGLEQSVTSQHLAILRRAGFVSTERDGKFIFYSVNYARLKEVHLYAEQLLVDETK